VSETARVPLLVPIQVTAEVSMPKQRRSEQQQDPFYIGYLPSAPSGIASHVRRAVVGLWVVAPILALLLAAAQRPFDVSFFEFGTVRTFEGTVIQDPHPLLLVDRPGGGTSRYYLVATGKHGAGPLVADAIGQRVRLDGTLIYRDDQTMLEGVEGSIAAAEGAAIPAAITGPVEAAHGTMTLRGEIVDSKCYLGVMKPGSAKPHRACASLCIRGGIPPLFVQRNQEGPAAYFLLVGPDGSSINQEILGWVAETIEITGEVVRIGDQWVLRAEPGDIKRL
jgi:hypothetical protein